jgi:hypothetical protein
MSTSDTQQTLLMLQEIESILTKVESKMAVVNRELPQVKDALETFTQLEQVSLRWVTLGTKIAGSPDVTKVTNALSRALIRMQMMYSSAGMIAGGIAEMAIPGMGFTGAIKFASGVAGMAMSQASMLEGY